MVGIKNLKSIAKNKIYSNVVRCPSKTTAEKMEKSILAARKTVGDGGEIGRAHV